LPPSPTFGTKVGLGEPRSFEAGHPVSLGEPRPFGAGDLNLFYSCQKCISSFALHIFELWRDIKSMLKKTGY